MRAAVVLLVLVAVFSTQVSETEALAAWFRKALQVVSRFLKDHVRIDLGLTRQARAAEKSLTSLGCSVENILVQYGCRMEGKRGSALKREAEAAIFAESDTNQDKKLTGEEEKTFELLFLKEILAMCLEKRAAAQNL